jgi:UDP-glucose 4-epimerase
LAAESRIQPAIKNPQLAYTTNVVGTLNVLELCRKHKVKKVIYSSTSSVYGLTSELPTTELAPIDCLNPYAHSKYMAEDLFRYYKDVDSVILRYFNVFGENSPTNSPYAPVIGIFMDQRKSRQPLTIVGDGKRRRDFIYVGDVVSANIAAMEFETNHAEVFNIGSGRNISIQEIADLISKDQIYLPDRTGEADNTLADITKAQSIGWSPSVFVEDWISLYE